MCNQWWVEIFFTCFRHNVHRHFDSCSLLQTLEKLTLCLTNLRSLETETKEEISTDVITALWCLRDSLPPFSLQEADTYLWLEGTFRNMNKLFHLHGLTYLLPKSKQILSCSKDLKWYAFHVGEVCLPHSTDHWADSNCLRFSFLCFFFCTAFYDSNKVFWSPKVFQMDN